MTEEKDQGSKDLEEDSVVELESQFVLRLPPTPAAALRAAVRSGVMSLKDRLSIQIEADMRHSNVKFDKWSLSGKIIDLPTILESYKTLDCKTFYKTADICQIMVCKEEDDVVKTDEEESPKKKDKKDAKDKRYMQLHGITPPLKNVRRRRFRKTLKKKYVDFPDIEKEVKRLFRMDNEAISVRYEVVNAEDEKNEVKSEGGDFSSENILNTGGPMSNSQSLDVAEYELFGDVLSSSDGEGNLELEHGENSQMSTNNSKADADPAKAPLVVEFSKNMLNSPKQQQQGENQDISAENANDAVLDLKASEENLGKILKEHKTEEKGILMKKLGELEREIADLSARRRDQEGEIKEIENQALKQKFQNMTDGLKQQEHEKQKEYDNIVSVLRKA